MNVYYVLLVFFLVWSFCMPKKSLATHTFERGFFLHGKNMAPIKKAKQKTNKTANKKYFVVYIQRRMMESNDRLLQEKGTQITLRHTHTHSYFYVCMLRYLHLFIHSVHDSEVLPISCRRSQTRKQHKKYGIK